MAPMRSGKPKRVATMTDVLRQSIVESGESYKALQRATGVTRASIMRFVRGERSLRLDKADALAAYYGLELRPSNQKGN